MAFLFVHYHVCVSFLISMGGIKEIGKKHSDFSKTFLWDAEVISIIF